MPVLLCQRFTNTSARTAEVRRSVAWPHVGTAIAQIQ